MSNPRNLEDGIPLTDVGERAPETTQVEATLERATATATDGQSWSLTQLLALMDEEQRTGILYVSWPQGEARIHIRRGRLTWVDQPDHEGDTWVLGEYLTSTRTLTTGELLAAQKDADKRRLSLEEALVNRRLVSEDVLKRFLDLQVAETLFPLFLQQQMQIRFAEERPKAPQFVSALPVAYIRKEAERRAELWPQLRRKVGGKGVVFNRDASVLAEILGYVDQAEGSEEELPELSASGRLIFYHVNGERTVEQLARASGLGIFETYRALSELVDAYLIEVLSVTGKGTVNKKPNPGMRRTVTVVIYLVMAGLLALGVQWVVNEGDKLTAALAPPDSQIHAALDEGAFARVEHSLQLYHVHHSRYPESLSALVSSGYLDTAAERLLAKLTYTRQGEAYVLVRN